jgi:TctA family transporter
MLLLAETALEKLQKVPADFWIKTVLAIVAFFVVVILVKKVAHMNKMVLGVVIFVVVGIVGFSWIYERNEPAFLTPVINVIAPFFPSKGAYEVKQSQDPSTPGPKKSEPSKSSGPAKSAPPAKKVY